MRNREDVPLDLLTFRILNTFNTFRAGKAEKLTYATIKNFNKDLLNLYYILENNYEDDIPSVFVGDIENQNTATDTNAHYDSLLDFIILSSDMVYDVKMGKKSLAQYLNTLGHENRHAAQQRALDKVNNQEVDSVDEYSKKVINSMYDPYLLNDKNVKIIYEYFISSMRPEDRDRYNAMSEKEKEAQYVKFASANYYNRSDEKDARLGGKIFCTTILGYLMSQPTCTDEMKKYIDSLFGKLQEITNEELLFEELSIGCRDTLVKDLQGVGIDAFREFEERIKDFKNIKTDNKDNRLEIVEKSEHMLNMMRESLGLSLKGKSPDELLDIYLANFRDKYDLTNACFTNILRSNLSDKERDIFNSKLYDYLLKEKIDPRCDVEGAISLLSDRQKYDLLINYLEQGKVCLVNQAYQAIVVPALFYKSKRLESANIVGDAAIDKVIEYTKNFVEKIQSGKEDISKYDCQELLNTITYLHDSGQDFSYKIASDQLEELNKLKEILENKYNSYERKISDREYLDIENKYGKEYADSIREKENNTSILDIKLDDESENDFYESYVEYYKKKFHFDEDEKDKEDNETIKYLKKE